MKPYSSLWIFHYYLVLVIIPSFFRVSASGDCDCGIQVYGEEYEAGVIKQRERIQGCNRQHCIFLIKPGNKTSLALSVESISMKFTDSVKYVFTAAPGVGFEIHSYTSWYGIWFGSSSFAINFERLDPNVKVCPHPLLFASTSFRSVPAIERPGPVRCPFRIIPSVAGRKIYLKFNKMWGTSLFLNEEQSNLRLIQTGTSGLHSATDSIDFVLESLGHHDLPKYNITYKELLEDPCYCDNKDIVVGEEPLYVTSPGFPDIYCSDFRCKRRFLHNDTLREDASLTFLVTVHFLSTEKYDYIEFSSDVKLCPYPLLRSSVNITNVPDIRRLGPIRCPVRVISSVPGREILLDFKDLGGTTFLERKENGDFRATPSGVLKRQIDKIDFVLEGLSPYHPPRYNITFKELTEDPCYCDEAYVVVGTKPVHTTSPEFPITHCSKFYSDGITMDRLNDTHKDVRLVLTGDIMETEFVTDNSIGGHGYNMTVESIHLPTGM
nr:unnamed protein product [Haemonchus contortus]